MTHTNNQTNFTIKMTSWPESENELRRVRQQVFIEEQAVPVALEWDEHDQDAVHILAQDTHNHAIGTARLLNDGHIGRMAVMKDWRDRGIGTAMLQVLLEYCEHHQLSPFLDAQTHAIGFYKKFGFKTIGAEFLDAGIPHRHMIREQ